MSLTSILKKGSKYLKEYEDNKKLKEAIELEEARKTRKDDLAKLTEKEKEYRTAESKRIAEYENFGKTLDTDWETELNSSVDGVMAYLNALRGIKDKEGIDYLSKTFHLPEDEATTLYKNLSEGNSKDRLRELYNNVYKQSYYISHFHKHEPKYEEYIKYGDYVIPNNTTRNATEVVTPKAEAISPTANTTPEVPKDPSKTGVLLNNILSGAATGSKNLSKALLKGAYDNHALYGAYVGGAGGAGYTYNNNENPTYSDYLKNALLGATIGAGAFAVPSATLRALSKSGSSPTTGSIFRAGVKYGAVPTAVGTGGQIYDYIKNVFNPPVPEKPSQSNSLQMFTPEQTPANTNGGIPVGTNQQDTSEYNRKPKGFRPRNRD